MCKSYELTLGVYVSERVRRRECESEQASVEEGEVQKVKTPATVAAWRNGVNQRLLKRHVKLWYFTTMVCSQATANAQSEFFFSSEI